MGLKTRIWHSEAADEIRAAVAEVRAQAKVSPPPAQPAADAPKAPVRLASMQKTIAGHVIDPCLLQEVPRATRPKPEMFATRVAPIEGLLADVDDATKTDVTTETKRPRITPTAVRRGLIVVLALAAGSMWSMRMRARTPPARPPAPPVVAAPSHPAPSMSPEAAVAPSPSRATSSTPQVDARRAVDALATGDFAAAERHYQTLARMVGGPSPYADAARILAARRLDPP